jgi:NAD(P)-dependent dehydrogenase (short-subunit alcohol dehydrogenase family)
MGSSSSRESDASFKANAPDAAAKAAKRAKGGKAIANQGDASKPEEIYRLVLEIKKQFGRVTAVRP